MKEQSATIWSLFRQFFARALIAMPTFLYSLAMLLSPVGYQKILANSYTNFSYAIHTTFLSSFFLPPSVILLHTYSIIFALGLLLFVSSLFLIITPLYSKPFLFTYYFFTLLCVHNPYLHPEGPERAFHTLNTFFDLGIASSILLI
jgi:hypothetical protein